MLFEAAGDDQPCEQGMVKLDQSSSGDDDDMIKVRIKIQLFFFILYSLITVIGCWSTWWCREGD